MWPSSHKPPTCHILSKLRLIHYQRTHLLLIGMVLLFSQLDFPVQSYEPLNVNNTQLDFDRTWYWTRRTSSSVRWWTIAWKYAYKNLMLQSGSPTRSVVRSSTRDRHSRIDYWTLNSRNVNSMFAASGWLMRRRSHICTNIAYKIDFVLLADPDRSVYTVCVCSWEKAALYFWCILKKTAVNDVWAAIHYCVSILSS